MKKTRKARMKRTPTGLIPQGEGWFVVNAGESPWYENEKFGRFTFFEGDVRFSQIGINIHVLEPNQPACHYHAESDQEDFLVLSGQALLLINGRKVELEPWDFVHCPPGTDHVFVGRGRGPCAILMVGARRKGGKLRYPLSRLAGRYDASSPRTTSSPRVSYATAPRSKPTVNPWPLTSRRPGRKKKR